MTALTPPAGGATIGAAIYETLLVRDGRPTCWDRHLDRLARSADGVGLPLPSSDEIVADVITALAGLGASVMRLRLTLAPDPQTGVRVVVSVGPVTHRQEPAVVLTTPWPRNPAGAVTGRKVVGAADTVVAGRWVRQRGGDEGLVVDTAGRVAEGLASNVFAVIGDRLVTPSLASGALGGTTRQVLIDATDAAEIDLWPHDLATADEVFLTSSTQWVRPARHLDGRDLPSIGGVAAEVAQAAEALRISEDADIPFP